MRTDAVETGADGDGAAKPRSLWMEKGRILREPIIGANMDKMMSTLY